MNDLILQDRIKLFCCALGILIGTIAAGCVHQPVTAPSGGAVDSGIGRTKTSISQAQSQQRQIAQGNARAQSDYARIDAKDKFLDAYRKWKTTHP